jgi:hypothetical protein
MRDALGNLDEPLELYSPEGELLGLFMPAIPHDEAQYAWARAQFTEEEVERARAQTGDITTAELLRRLEAL